VHASCHYLSVNAKQG